MKYAPAYAIQASGEIRQWSNPQRTFHYSLVKLRFDCEADPYAGILILTDRSHMHATAMLIRDLRKELPKVLEPLGEGAVGYWRSERNETVRDRLLAGLTIHPIFDDILG